ncbi:unnamed protein product, partial [Ectocarpus sp. 13 AM-2016]
AAVAVPTPTATGEDKAGRVSPSSDVWPSSAHGKRGSNGVSGVVTAEGGVGAAEQSRLALQLWWPLLTGLARGAGDPRLDCRAAALSTLQDILKEFGSAPEFSL